MSTMQEQANQTSIRILLLVLFLSLLIGKASGQSLALTEAYQLLEDNYAVLQNAGLNDRILQTELDILDLERKPTLYLKASPTIQSETTSLGDDESVPLSLDLPLYNARAYGELNYTIRDGGRLEARKNITEAEAKIANQELEVERFALHGRINQLFLGVMLNRERLAIYDVTLADITARQQTVGAAVAEGAALESELLQLEVRETEIVADRDNVAGQTASLLANLSTLVGRRLPQDIILELPDLPNYVVIPELQRPEFELLSLRKAAVLANNELIEANRKPMLTGFVQAGVGFPNPVNLFDNGVAPYAIGGLNFQWQFKDWGRAKKQKEILQLRALQLDRQEESLRFDFEAGNEAYLVDVQRLRRLIEQDQKIVRLQSEILVQLASQLDNGVITSADYLIQTNAELRARQQLKIHETELQQLQLNFLNNRGGF